MLSISETSILFKWFRGNLKGQKQINEKAVPRKIRWLHGTGMGCGVLTVIVPRAGVRAWTQG